MKVKVGKYEYQKSTRKGKKLSVVVNEKTIHFGSSKMQHFKDKTVMTYSPFFLAILANSIGN